MKTQIIPKYMKIFLICLSMLTIIFYVTGFTILKFSGYNFSQCLNTKNSSDLNTYFSKNNIKNSSTKTFTIDKNITTIDVQIKHQDINLYSYDGNELKVEIKNSKSLNNNISYTTSNNKIVIKPLNSIPSNAVVNITVPNKFLENGLFEVNNLNGDISANNFSVQSLNLSSISGDIQLSNLNSKYISISNTSGDIECEDVIVSSESTLNSASGDIECSGDFGKLSANSTSGDIEIYINKNLSSTSLNSSSGLIKLDIPSSSSYNIDYYTMSGDCDIDALNNGDNPSPIMLKTMSGDIDVSTHD